MPRSSSRPSVSKTPSSAEKRVTRRSTRSPAAATKSSPAVKKSPATKPLPATTAVSSAKSAKKSAELPAARSRSRAAAAPTKPKSPSPKPQRQRSPSSAKRKSTSPKAAKLVKSPGTKSASRGRSKQRKGKKAKDDDDEVAKTPVKQAAKRSRTKSKEKAAVAATKSPPGRGRGQSKSSSPKQKRGPSAHGRRSQTAEKDEEEHAEEQQEDKEEDKEEDREENKEEDGEEDKGEETETGVGATADDEEKLDSETAVERPMDEGEAACDEAEVTDAERMEATKEAEPMLVSHANSLVTTEDSSPRKRKFEEIEDESSSDEDGEGEEPGATKVLKTSEESDVKSAASVEAPMKDGELTTLGADAAEVEAEATASYSKLSLPLSTATEDTNIEDDYIIITPDDVPPVDSDKVMNTAAKMIPSTSNANDDDALLVVGDIPNPILNREYVANPSADVSVAVDASRRFTLGSYNILADYHAQKDYGFASWLTRDQLSLSSRHQRLVDELIYLDEDVICLQEVGGDYMYDLLQPTLESLGYQGVFIARNTSDYCEGEATFFRTSRFSLMSSESLLLSDIINQALDTSPELDESTRSLLKDSLSTHAVAMLTRLRNVASGDMLTVANIHVAYDKFERQDRQCLQLAVTMQRLIELAGGLDKPHVICGDFNAWPGSAPYQLMSDGHLSDTSFTDLQAILTIDSGDMQLLPVVNFWSDGFQYPVGSDMKSAYATVQGSEPMTADFGGHLHAVDYIWFSSVSLEVLGVLKVVDPALITSGLPTATFPSDHVSVKASFVFK